MKENNKNFSMEKKKNKDYYETTQLIINIIVDKLNEVGFKIDEKHVSKFTLENYLKDIGDKEHTEYKINLYLLTQLMLRGDYEDFCKTYNDYCRCLGEQFNISKEDRDNLVVSQSDFDCGENQDISPQKCQRCNIMESTPVMGTVHSVKGETHDITLFLESFYNKNYECDILHDVLCGKRLVQVLKDYKEETKRLKEEINEIKAKGITRGISRRVKEIDGLGSKMIRSKQYAKIIYVALTRARNIVGYGVSEEKYNKYLKGSIDTEEWEILLVE